MGLDPSPTSGQPGHWYHQEDPMLSPHSLSKSPAAVIAGGASAAMALTKPFTEPRGSAYPNPLLHSPRHNRLLAALPDQEYAALLPHLELVCMPLGWLVHGARDLQKYLYFLTEGIVSRFYVMENGETAEFASTGSDGVIGLAAFLGGSSMPSQTSVVHAGYAYRLRGDWVREEFARGGLLPKLLLRYVMAVAVQAGQTAACNRHHSIRARLGSLILANMDRLPRGELKMTQELLADALGVRRESVTEAMGILQATGAISRTRGRIRLLNRGRLEAQACECYAVVKHEHNRLLPTKAAAH